MRSKIGKIVLMLSLVLCMSASMCLLDVSAASTSDNCSNVFKAYTAERASQYLAGDNTYPEKEGYLFAGWYTDDNATEETMVSNTDSLPDGVEAVYALFVPEDVLTIKAQASQHLMDSNVTTDDEKGAVRFVTSVDSLLYRQVGFEISYIDANGVQKNATSASRTVYKKLYVTESDKIWDITPSEIFCGVSTYFKACTVKNVPVSNYTTEFTVKPYWITMSGDKVYGETATKKLEEGCIRDEVYVSSTPEIAQDLPYYGTVENPYASLDYAITHVKDGGIVRVKDALTVASDATWEEHGKSITITGYAGDEDAETLDFSGMSSHLYINDNVTFSALNLKFKQYVFCNGYSVKVANDINLLNSAADENLSYIYGGGNTKEVANTNLELYAGSYQYIYGGCHNANVTGDTKIVIGPGVNEDADPTSHNKDYLLYGGCRIGTVGGNTYVIVQKAEDEQTPAKFNYVYGGGGYAESTKETATVKGTTNVEFAGQTYSIYGGGRYGTNADTHVVMTGGEVYQIFGGCENNSMEGNTDVQVLGGKVYRRIYGGCYNDYSTDPSDFGWSDTLYQVTGYASVTIGVDAELSLDTDTDSGLLAVSRYESAFSNEWGVFIFNDDMYSNSEWSLSSEIGSSFFTNNQAYHYLVKANAGGDVRSDGNFIYIKPDSGNVATVTIGGVVKHYTESNSYYQLPALSSSSSQEEIVVTFGTTVATEFVGSAAAKISTGSEAYAYYETLEQAIAAAEKSENATIEEIGATTLASIDVLDSANGTIISNHKNCVAGTTVTLTVEPEDGYYCSALSVTKDDEAVALKEELTIDGTTYTFDTEAGDYTVEATFAKKVFENPSSEDAKTTWKVLQQNQNIEKLQNGGTKISGTIGATGLATGSGSTLRTCEMYTDLELTVNLKEVADGAGTTFVFDFDGYVFYLRAVENGGNKVLRVVGGSKNASGKNYYFNAYTFDETQTTNYTTDGVEVRLVRYGTELFLYVDGKLGETAIDLAELSASCGDTIVTESTKVTVGIQLFNSLDQTVSIPFSITDTVTPVAVNIDETTNGIVTKDKVSYFAGDIVTLTVEPEDGYYCSALSVTKDGEAVTLNEELTIDGTTYTFGTEAGDYTVEATFVKKVFEISSSNGYTSWNLLNQNESTEILANGGTKITGTVYATDLQEKDKMDAIKFVDNFIEMDLTYVAKDDPNATAGSTTPGTQIVMDFNGYAYQVRAVKNSGNIVLRVVGGMSANTNMYTFTTAQAEKFASADGVEIRMVRYGTEVFFYVDGTYAYKADLSQLNSIVTADREMTVSIKRFGDTNTEVAIPFTMIDTVTPVTVNIDETTNGIVTKDKVSYFAGDIVTLTVEPEDGYYCSALSVTKDGEAVTLNEELTIDGTTYTFDAEAGDYTVETVFAKKVFEVSSSNGYTSWNLLNQNESTEILANGGTKITGTVYATDLQEKDKMDAIKFVDNFVEMDLTYVAKDDPNATAGSTTPGTQVVMDFNGYSYQVRAVKNSGNIVLRVVGGMTKNTNMYTFTTEQAEKFASSEGVVIRMVRTGTSVTFYVDGAFAYTADLSALNSIVTADREMTVSIKRFGDTNIEVAIPFSVSDKVTPVAVEVYDDGSALVANENYAADVQNIDLTSNETYSVKLTPQGVTGYFKITYVDHVTKETQSVYTPAITAGESFEFTYKNGLFNAETEAEIATILWENRIKATKDVLTVQVINGAPEGDTIEANAVLGREPMAKPASETVSTSWTLGSAVSTTGEITENANYAYTDVITVAKKGTKLSFTDSVKTDSWATGDVFVVSSWKQDENEAWVIDTEGTNIAGQYTTGEITCTEGYEVFIERYGTDSITYTYITSEDNENIRFCYYAGEGTTSFPKIISTYSGETGTAVEIALAADTAEWLNNDKVRAYYDIFEGKTISVIGDSYMAGSSITNTGNVWVNMFAKKYGMTINNHGVNGSTISNYAGATYNPMVDRWETDFENDTPDIIIVEGGRNDYNYNTPMGEIGTIDKGTMKGATTYLVSSLKEKYPNAVIIGITCWEVGGNKNAAGYYCSDYGRAFIDVCENLGIPYVNAMDSETMNVYMTSSNFRGRFCIKAGDISHLNEKGMKLVLPIFEEKIYNICK